MRPQQIAADNGWYVEPIHTRIYASMRPQQIAADNVLQVVGEKGADKWLQ